MLWTVLWRIRCRWLSLVKKNKENKIPRKEDDKDLVEKLQQNLLRATERKEKATTTEDKLSSTADVEAAKAELKKVDNMTNTQHLTSGHYFYQL
jgi:hypothetical protein